MSGVRIGVLRKIPNTTYNMNEYNGQCVVDGCEHHFVAATDDDIIRHFNSTHGDRYMGGGFLLRGVKSFDIALNEEQRQKLHEYESK